jgi:hypothetical protein
MDTMEVFHVLYIVFLIFGILLLVATVFEFFAFNITKIFQDLTGITKRREIKKMTENTEYTGQLKYKTNLKRNEKLLSPSGRLSESPNTTGKLHKAKKKAVITPPPAKEEMLTEAIKEPVREMSMEGGTKNTTDVSEADTGVLNTGASETAVLTEQTIKERQQESETSVLSETRDTEHKEIHFLLERQILMTHTNEVIDM